MAAAPIPATGSPPWLRELRHRVAVLGQLLLVILLPVFLLLIPAAKSVAAAEVLQVRGPSLLQLGDRNRSYSVELVCQF